MLSLSHLEEIGISPKTWVLKSYTTNTNSLHKVHAGDECICWGWSDLVVVRFYGQNWPWSGSEKSGGFVIVQL